MRYDVTLGKSRHRRRTNKALGFRMMCIVFDARVHFRHTDTIPLFRAGLLLRAIEHRRFT